MQAPTLAWHPSAVQQEMLRFPLTDADHCFIVGGKGSGKSSGACRSFANDIVENHVGREFLCAAKTTRQVKFVIRRELETYLNWLGVPHHFLETRWVIASADPSRPNVIHPVVFGEQGSVAVAANIQGLNLAGSLVDEAENAGKAFRDELGDRLRVGSKPRGWWTLNPTGGPRSLFKREMIDNDKVRGVLIHSPVDPKSPWLPDDWIERLEARYPNQWQRDIHIGGLWAAPQGLVFPNAWRHYDDGGNVQRCESGDGRLIAGVDGATRAVTHGVLVRLYDGIAHVVAEWHHDARDQEEMLSTDKAEALRERFAPFGKIKHWVCDPASADIRLSLETQGELALRSGMHGRSIHTGIAKLKVLFGDRRLRVDPVCDELIDQMASYSYPHLDYEKEHTSVVNPIHLNCDGIDSLRYALDYVSVRSLPRPTVSGSGGLR